MRAKMILLVTLLAATGCASNGTTFEDLMMTCRDSSYELDFLGLSGSFKRSVDCPNAEAVEQSGDAESQPSA